MASKSKSSSNLNLILLIILGLLLIASPFITVAVHKMMRKNQAKESLKKLLADLPDAPSKNDIDCVVNKVSEKVDATHIETFVGFGCLANADSEGGEIKDYCKPYLTKDDENVAEVFSKAALDCGMGM